jgi:hypothetical protein
LTPRKTCTLAERAWKFSGGRPAQVHPFLGPHGVQRPSEAFSKDLQTYPPPGRTQSIVGQILHPGVRQVIDLTLSQVNSPRPPKFGFYSTLPFSPAPPFPLSRGNQYKQARIARVLRAMWLVGFLVSWLGLGTVLGAGTGRRGRGGGGAISLSCHRAARRYQHPPGHLMVRWGGLE